MPPPSPSPKPTARVYLLALVAYVAAFYTSYWTVSLGDSLAPIWLGTGLAVWLVQRFGPRMLWVVVLGELIPKLLRSGPLGNQLDLLVRCLMSSGNVLSAFLGAWLWRHFRDRWQERLGEFCEPLACIAIAVGAPMAAATVGGGSLVISGQKLIAEGPALWFGWWAADAIGVLLFLPLLLSAPALWRDLRTGGLRQLTRLIGILLLTAGLSWLAFQGPEGGRYLFALFPLIVLGTYWCGQGGVRLLACLVVAAGTFAAAYGRGPLVTGNLHEDLVTVQLFLSGIALLALLVPPLHARFNLFRAQALTLLFGGWALSGLMFVLLQAQQQREDRADFAAQTDRAQQAIERRLAVYTDALRGAASFLLASPHVGHAEWLSYVNQLNLSGRYPGVIGVGLVYPVEPRRTAEFFARAQADGAQDLSLHGVPGAEALASRPEHYVLTYLEPHTGFHTALGMDLGTDPVRRQALEAARDSGQPRITGRISIVDFQEPVPGFVLFVPVYRPGAPLTTVAERRTALVAWVDAPFLTASFLRGALGERVERLAVHLFDDGVEDRAHLIFASGPPSTELPAFARTTTFELAGRKLLLGWNRSAGAKDSRRSPLIWLCLSFSVGTVLLTGWMLSLQLFRERAEALVIRRTIELAESEARFRTLIERSPEAVVVHRQGKFIYGNPAALRLIGAASSADLFGRAVIERVHPDYRAAVLQRIAEVNDHGNDGPMIAIKLIRLDGAVIEAESQVTAIVYNGTPAVHSVLRDVTARNRAEAARTEILARLQKIARQVPGLVYQYRVRPDGRASFPFASEAIREIYRVAPDEVREDSAKVTAVLHPEDLAAIMASIQVSARDLTLWQHEYRVKFPDGTIRWLLGNAQPEREADGGTLWHGFITDITARKAAEAELYESRQKLAAIFDNAAAYIFLKDRDGRYLFANKLTCELFGVTAETLVGSRDSAYFPPETAQRLREVDERVLRGEKTAEEITVNGRDGDYRVYWEVKSPIYAQNETKPWGVLGVSTDITASKRIEAAQQRLEEQNRQLQKSESLGRMAAAIAHHFNNQLHAMMLNLEMANTELPPISAPAARLAEAMKCARKASEVSNHMLTYLGQAQGKHTPQDLADICRSSLPLLQAVAPKNIVLDLQLPFPGPLISANANQLQQALTNLLTNAWEACGDQPGRVRLTVRTASVHDIPAVRLPPDWQPKDTAYACLEVADTGAGIAPQDVEKIFDPFYSSKFVGRGLGLSVVLGIVRSHQGVIAVQSKPGQGSAFTLFFPLALVAKPAGTSPGERTVRPGPGRTVLLAEDDPVVLKVTVQALRHFGFSVLAAKDGIEALELFRAHQPEIGCIVCDLSMPRLGGWQTLAEIRRLAPTLPAILSSGLDEAAALEGHRGEMPQVFLNKPYDIKLLVSAITQVLTAGVK